MKKLINISLLILTFSILNAQIANDTNYQQIINLLEKYTFTDTLTIEDLFILTKRSDLRNKYINQLKFEIRKLNQNIETIKLYISELSLQLEKYQKIYAQLLEFLYLNKNISYNTLTFLLSAKSLNEAYLKIKYLQIITEYLQNTAQTIKLLKKELEYQKQIMEKSLKLRKKLLSKIQKQQALLQEELTLLNDIKHHQQIYQQLKQQIIQYELRQAYLANIILRNLPKIDAKEDITQNFELKKGLFSPPLNNPIVIIPFGVHQHHTLKGIKIRNDGIDITSPNDTIVKAIFQGTVIKTLILPNAKKAVIIKHGDYYTVYSNLATIFVKEGDKILENQKIGTIRKSQNNNFPILNFQIWYKTQKLNPQHWLNI